MRGPLLAVRECVHPDHARVLEIASGRHGGVRYARVSADFSARDELKLVNDLHAAGYLAVRPDATSSQPREESLLHRHLALICRDADPKAAVEWIRGLSLASPRRHIVIGCRPAADRLAYLSDAVPITEGARELRPRLKVTTDWSVYSCAACLLAETRVASADLESARSLLHGLRTEAIFCGLRLPRDYQHCDQELAFWLGDRDDDPAQEGVTDSLAMGWRALRYWRGLAAGKLPALRAQLILRNSRGDAVAGLWAAVLGCLCTTTDSAAAELANRARDERLPIRLRSLASAIAGRAWLRCHRAAEAENAFSLVRPVGPEAQLVSSLRSNSRSPLVGVGCLVNDRFSDNVSALLHQLEESPDEASALASGCSWVQRHGRTPSVGIVSADCQRLVAACGWKTADLSGEIASLVRENEDAGDLAGKIVVPIRYAGTMLGRVVVRGSELDQSSLQQAAQTLAAVCGSALRGRLDALALHDRDRECAPEILGNSPSMSDVRVAIARAAGTGFPVLIEGESGTGKELVARAVHRLSARRDRRLVAVNCAALTDELVEAELFGHVRGAFTGATGARNGLFEEASGGTIFLDEVSELSSRAQAKLLRVLQEREIRRVGENSARRVDVRTVAATNVPLTEAVAGGRFRDDLRFRLAVIRIRLPPLRDRLEDLPLLTHVLWRRALSETGKRAVLSPDVMASLGRHPWPGNVRELQNVIAGLAVAAPVRGRVTGRHVAQVLADLGSDETSAVPLDRARHLFERRMVAAALARHAGRRSAAASELGLTRQGLSKALRRLGLSSEEDSVGVA